MTAFAAKDTVWTNDELWSPNYLNQIGPGGSFGAWEEGVWYNRQVLEDDNGQFYFIDDDGIRYDLTYNDKTDSYDYVKGGVAMSIVRWYDDTHLDYDDITTARDSKGYKVDISWKSLSSKTLKSIDEEKKIAEIFKKNGYEVPDDTDFVPLLTGSINFTNGVPEGGGRVTFNMADLGINSEGVKPGETVYVMQETAPGSGVWEVYAATVGQDLDVVVTVPRNGALVLVKTLSDGTVITLDKATGNVIDRQPADNTANNNAANNNANNANNNASGSTGTSSVAAGATSPKTGEF